MKFKIFFLAMTMIMACTAEAQTKQGVMLKISLTNGKLANFGQDIKLTTPDATPVIADTMAIADNSAGLIEVYGSGSSAAGDGVTGKLIYRYHKSAGTITLGSATSASAIVADTNVSGATFAVAATASNNLKLTVTGKSALPVQWHLLMNQFRN